MGSVSMFGYGQNNGFGFIRKVFQPLGGRLWIRCVWNTTTGSGTPAFLWPDVARLEQCSKPLLVDDFGGLQEWNKKEALNAAYFSNYMMKFWKFGFTTKWSEIAFWLVVEIAPGRPLYLRRDFYLGTHSAWHDGSRGSFEGRGLRAMLSFFACTFSPRCHWRWDVTLRFVMCTVPDVQVLRATRRC